MTTLMMPSEYGVEMYLGSSPVLTSYLSAQSFLDYPRLPPPPACQPQPTNSIGLHSLWDQPSAYSSGFGGGCRLDGMGSSCSSEYNSGLATRDSIRRRARSRRSPPKRTEAPPPLLTLQPTKSCLVARQEEELEEGLLSPTRLKKRVVFADDQGHPLIEVRLLTERPDSPPRWSADFLEQVTGGAKAEALCDQWEMAFAQPAADYLSMKTKLEEKNVSLENVLVKEAESRVTGTVKVRNLSYHKHVKVRYTTSNWVNYEDVPAEYVPTTSTTNSYDLYDTFSFVLPLPSSSQADKLEFCVCYTADHMEYWDNNNNQNYVLVSFRSKNSQQEASKPNDVYRCSLDSWSEFASWNHLALDDSPYW